MVIKPRVRNNICINAHPEGCRQEVLRQIEYIKSRTYGEGPKNVLVVGCSTGYGLASRIVAAFGNGAATLGVSFEKPGDAKRAGTPGWYNNRTFDQEAGKAGLYSETLNGDAFSEELKAQAAEKIAANMDKIDLIVYSLASPVRKLPDTGELVRSVLKPLGKTYSAKSIDAMTGEIGSVSIEPATAEEAADTVKVMGGEDWQLWIKHLQDKNLLAENVKTIAYSYIGPDITFPVYREGTIGGAKEHLEQTAHELTEQMSSIGGTAYVSVNKALVTRSSAYIPVVPLYISLLFKFMKELDIHEGCIEQCDRLYRDFLYNPSGVPVDEKGRIRIDDWEMRDDVQEKVHKLWDQVTSENLDELTDIVGYRKDFLNIHGFDVDGVDYEAEARTD